MRRTGDFLTTTSSFCYRLCSYPRFQLPRKKKRTHFFSFTEESVSSPMQSCFSSHANPSAALNVCTGSKSSVFTDSEMPELIQLLNVSQDTFGTQICVCVPLINAPDGVQDDQDTPLTSLKHRMIRFFHINTHSQEKSIYLGVSITKTTAAQI